MSTPKCEMCGFSKDGKEGKNGKEGKDGKKGHLTIAMDAY